MLACGGEQELPLADLDSRSEQRESAQIVACKDETERECHVTLAQQGDVISCYVGVELCVNGVWSECTHGSLAERTVSTRALSAWRLNALTATENCDSNPCDPTCEMFEEAPEAPPPELEEIGGSIFDWKTGSLTNYPPGLVKKGLVEPCETGADCQFNTYCANPVSNECSHDLCKTGAALNSGCSSCAESVCEVDETCCEATVPACEHELCVAGTPLKAECDPCVESICEEYPACCKQSNGAWDDTCIAAVTSVCGATCGCCAGEQGHADSCYKVASTAQTWAAARTSCESLGNDWDLASIESSTENSFLYSLDADNHWLGLTEGNGIGTTSNWAWSNGDPSGSWNETTLSGLPYSSWAASEPNSSSYWKNFSYGNWKNCARMKSSGGGSWAAEECTNTYEALCEGPPLCLGEAPPPAAACSHDPCASGAALNSRCDVCAQAVCAADPTCCTNSWTASCVALVASECTAQCSCATGETSYGGHCYYTETASKTWSDARTSCQARGNGWDLVSIGNSSEKTHVNSQFSANSSQDLWLGFQESSNKWTWSNGSPSGQWKETGGGSTISYTNWTSGQPNDSGNNCAYISTGGTWYDKSCANSKDSVCEGSPVKLSSHAPVSTPGSLGTAGGGSGSVINPEWTQDCVDKVASVCDAACQADESGEGVCQPWYPGQTDTECAKPDLALGVPCDDSIPVCNHGTLEAPAGITLVHFPGNSQQYPSCTPDQSHPQMYSCTTTEPIPAGSCINVTDCPKLSGNRELMVNPSGPSHVDECSCSDNWSLYSGGECGPPTCSGGTSETTLEKRPVDIIIAVDNSGSMANVIKSVQQRINDDFAEIIQASDVDYRVIMVSRYGNVNIANYDCVGFNCIYSAAYSVCVGSPLSELTCPATAIASTPTLTNKEGYFYHHSTDIGSRDVLCKLLDAYDTSDPYPSSRTNWTPVAPSGWGAFLREEALKVFVVVTDDGISGGGGTGECAASTGLADTLAGAQKWDQTLREMAPEQFGVYSAADPDSGRNYIFHSIIGLAGNNANPPSPLAPTEPVETKCCQNNSTTSRTCPNTSSDTAGGIRYGLAYQELSRMSGGLRYPICFNSNFDDVFNAIAEDVVEVSKVSCDFALQNVESADINTATVRFQKASSSSSTELTRASSLAACGSNQWYVEDANDPSVLSLCPTTCAEAQSSSDSTISVEVGCAGSAKYDAYSFTQVYEAQCEYDQIPQWAYCSIETTTPSDTSVTLEIRSAAVEVELTSVGWRPLAVLSTANGNNTCSGPASTNCPLDIYAALGGAAPEVNQSFVEVQVTFTPDSSGTQLPEVEEWSLSYSCIDAQ